MKLWLCLVMLSCAAAVQDMTGKVFTFPQPTDTAHVKLNVGQDTYRVMTICHRSFTDLKRDHSLFSLATPSKFNAALTFYDASLKAVSLHFNDERVTYGDLDYAPNKWHSMCATWSAETGLMQLWFDGQPLTKKYGGHSPGSSATVQPVIVLGQEQDSYGGGFDAKQSFVGMMTDVHMWDHELSPCEIQKYTDELSFTPGNKINWAALDFQTNGNVVVENKIQGCDSQWIKTTHNNECA